MPSNITINFDYDKTELLDLYNNTNKETLNQFSRVRAKLDAGSCELPIFSRYFNTFEFVPKSDLSIELLQFTGNTRPHINTGNNGLLIFPISGNPLTVNTYSYVTPNTDASGRLLMPFMNMSANEVSAIEETLVDSLQITQPIAIDGLTTFSLHSSSSEPYPIALILKISKLVDWSTVYSFLEKDLYAKLH